MAQDSGPGGRKAVPAAFAQRSRKRWIVIGSVAGAWLVLYVVGGSALSATVLLAVFALCGALAVLLLRSMGVTREHPWIRRLASRPWRDGQAVLRVAMSHFRDVFVITPGGSVFAPNRVEIQMSPEDLVSLCDRMELGVITASATEVYEEQVAQYGARFGTSQRADVYVVADESIPRGRFRLRQGRPAAAARRQAPDPGYGMGRAPELAYAGSLQAGPDPDEWAGSERGPARTPVDARMSVDARTVVDVGPVTVMEKTLAPVPVLRLVTGDSVAQTRMTGARAGRGPVELVLPNVPTISREHARFAFAEGRWWVTNLGINGLSVNGVPAATEHPLGDGDTIQWGSRPDALVSRVTIG